MSDANEDVLLEEPSQEKENVQNSTTLTYVLCCIKL